MRRWLAGLVVLAGCGMPKPIVSTTPLQPDILPRELASETGRHFVLGTTLDTAGLLSRDYIYSDHPHTYVLGVFGENRRQFLIVSPDTSGVVDFIEIRYPPPARYDSVVAEARSRLGTPSVEYRGRRAEWRGGTRMLVIQEMPEGYTWKGSLHRVEALLWHCSESCQ